MPSVLSYPGVYIEEVPSSVRAITGVSTSVTAFIGRSLRGPVNEPITINSYADFERNFGSLWTESYMPFAVRDYFLNGGSQAIIVRLFNPNDDGDVTGSAKISVPAGNELLLFEATSPGSWGDGLEIFIDHEVPEENRFGLEKN